MKLRLRSHSPHVLPFRAPLRLTASVAAPEETVSAAGLFDEMKHPRVPHGEGGGRFTVKENAAGRFEVVAPSGAKVAETTDASDADALAGEKNMAVPLDAPMVAEVANRAGTVTDIDSGTLGEVLQSQNLTPEGAARVVDELQGRDDLPDEVRALMPVSFVASAEPCEECDEAAAAIVAAIPVQPPVEWFDMDEPDEAVPLTVTSDGQVFGHAAIWGTCHLGNPRGAGVCVQPPPSRTDYALFHLGEVETASGERVPVGQITLDTGHAPIGASARTAAAHYDDTGTVVADVRARNGNVGIWMAGALRSDVTAEKVRALTASKISGDWRGGELVAMLAVNVPGFPVPRTRARLVASADGGEQVMALVAAGIVGEQEPTLSARDVEIRVAVLAARAEGGLEGLAALAASGLDEDLTAGMEVTIRIDDPPTVEVPVIVDREKLVPVIVPGETVVVDRERLVPVTVPGETVVVENERVQVVQQIVPQIVTTERVQVVPQIRETHTIERVAAPSASAPMLVAGNVPRSYDREIAQQVDFFGTHGYWSETALSGAEYGARELSVIRAAAEMVATATSVEGGLLRDRLAAEGYLR